MPPSAHSSNPGFTVDWRHLLPLENSEKILVLCRDILDIASVFQQAGIPGTLHQADFSALPHTAIFDAIALPFGAPEPLRAEYLQRLRLILHPGGTLLLGFEKRRALTPNSVTRLLHHADFSKVEFYGVMPDLRIPEYTFPLAPAILSFVLQQRYKRKLPVRLLPLAFAPICAPLFSALIPAYYALATP